MTKRSFAPKVETKPEPPTSQEEPEKTEEPKVAEPKADTDTEKTEPRKPVLIRQGKTRMPTAKKPDPPKKSPPIGSKASVAAGLVRKQTIHAKGVHPTVSNPPKKTARAGMGSSAGETYKRPYWLKVADKYGI